MSEISAVLVIAYRDIIKFLRDRPRLIATFAFPLIFIGALGGSMQSSFGRASGIDLLIFTFTGVYAQTLFQSSCFGLISLLMDRESDFSQEIFVSPISRYSIVIGKIVGEGGVSLIQGVGIILFGLVIGASLGLVQVLGLAVAGIVACLIGGAFGLLILAWLPNQRAASQVFPFIILPQYFLGGVFSPIKDLPVWLDLLSLLSPLRYVTDLTRGLYYAGRDDYDRVVLAPPIVDLAIITVLFVIFVVIGTAVFVRSEQNR